ncbi:MAG: methyltransferase domain-containing protein [Actinomycetota bacterium]
MSNKTRMAYDRWSEKYDAERNPQILMEHDEVVRLVDARPGESILDAACGTGKYTIEFHNAGAAVMGVDFSDGMLAVAARKHPALSFRYADLSLPLPFEAASFDKVNCAQALKHIADLRAVFRDVARVLRPGGAFIFSVTHPDMCWDDYEIDSRADVDLRAEADMHDHRFCDYFEALERNGFDLDRLVQIPVSDKIKHLLTPESFWKVQGRYQVLAIRAKRHKQDLGPTPLPCN